MNVLRLLEKLEDIIESSSTMPFGGKTLIDKEETLDIIEEIRVQLPDEVKQAQWIKEERQRILIEAQKEADNMTFDAKEHVEGMVERDEITKKAQRRAEEIISEAQRNAKEIRIGARQYADELLVDMEKNMHNILDILSSNREELKGMKG